MAKPEKNDDRWPTGMLTQWIEEQRANYIRKDPLWRGQNN
jgi:hypothetical protein